MAFSPHPDDANAGDEHVGQKEEEDEEEEELVPDLDHLEKIKDKPCRVHDVFIRGNARTKERVIERQLEAARKAQTFGELLAAVAEARERLQALPFFTSVEITMDEGPPELPDTANIHVTVAEDTGRSVSVGSSMEGNEKSVEGKVALQNQLGHGEALLGEVKYGAERSTLVGLSLHWPHWLDRAGDLQLRLEQTRLCWQRHASHSQGLRALAVSYELDNQRFRYELSWRHNSYDLHASPAVRRMLGHSLLSAVQYTFYMDRLDSLVRPRRGFAWNATTTLAVGPTAQFVTFAKQEVQGKVAIPLGVLRGAAVGSLRAGVLLPLSAAGPSLLNDRFFLHGPNTVRGFKSHGLGPVDRRPDGRGWDRLGGDLMLAASAGLSFDFPLRPLQRLGIHWQAFACAANLAPLGALAGVAQAPARVARELLDTSRLAVGVGVVVPIPVIGKLEVNYCWVLRKQATDRAVGSGLQGIQFCLNGW